jgi:hypothetical protein
MVLVTANLVVFATILAILYGASTRIGRPITASMSDIARAFAPLLKGMES